MPVALGISYQGQEESGGRQDAKSKTARVTLLLSIREEESSPEPLAYFHVG